MRATPLRDLLKRLAASRVALLGLGVENRALARFLADHRVAFCVCDAREPADRAALTSELGPWLRAWHLGPDYLQGVSCFDVVFRTPGLRPDHPALVATRRAGARVSSQTRLFAAVCPAPLVGVTGTKGKGTTAALLAAMLQTDSSRRVWLGGNIGTAPVSWLGEMRPEDSVVLELSSFQLADWDLSPMGAVVLHIDEDHLDYHGSRAAYVEAKSRIAAAQGRGDWLLVDGDCPTAACMAGRTPALALRFSLEREVDAGAWVSGGEIHVRLPGGSRETVCGVDEIRLRGRHNWSNVAAATAAARMLGVGTDGARAAIRAFVGLPHRLQRVATRNGVDYYDDSLATTPAAAAAALAAFREPVILIAGGSGKKADFGPLVRAVGAAAVRAVILIGTEAPRLATALRAAGWTAGPVLEGGSSMETAVALASRWAQPGDVVLLAPACASFDMFRDYRERGERFSAAATSLA